MTDTAEARAREKWCAKCSRMQPLSEFYKDKHRADGLRTICSDCDKAKARRVHLETRSGNPEYRREQRERMRNRRLAGLAPTTREKRHAERYREKYPDKQKAKRAVRRALEKGELQRPAACEACGSTPAPGTDGRCLIQAHHDDYAKPLDVRWLCPACHAAVHNGDRHVG